MDDDRINRIFSDSTISTLAMHPFKPDLLSETRNLYAQMKLNHRNEYFYVSKNNNKRLALENIRKYLNGKGFT